MRLLDACPTCGGSAIREKFEHVTERRDTFHVFACENCDHRFICPQPSFDELAPYYQDGYRCYAGCDERVEAMVSAARHSGKLRHISVEPGMSILDYGCGSGDFVVSALRLGALAVGIEPSAIAAQRAREAGATVFEGTLETLDRLQIGGPFDAITMNHVLEHIPEPSKVLKGLSNLLQEDGFLWIAVPNADCWGSRVLRQHWHSADLPRHLHHFTSESLRYCGAQAGLRLISMTTDTPAHSMANTIQLVLRKKFRIPFRVSNAFGLLPRFVAPRLAMRADRRQVGEALIATFARTPAAVTPQW
ncbi:MAG: class I SAM-dependent methyltransferase [Planctomycetota bacterium]|nr:class I SAM-dependent methyltransferase [Planctomycetota bacterium]